MLWRFFSSRFATKAQKLSVEAPVGILERYKQFQDQHPQHIVLMQVGDFYEIYGEAVEAATKILDITATRAPGKLIGNTEPVAMTGFPIRSFDTYLGKLIRAGRSVVVADQIPIPLSSRFDRRISRIVTPGTVVEEHLLEGSLNNYIVFLASEALAWMDVSTGDFWVSQVTESTDQMGLLARLRPREILYTCLIDGLESFASKHKIVLKSISNDVQVNSKNVKVIDSDFIPSSVEMEAAIRLAEHVKTSTLLSLSLKPLRQFVCQSQNMSIDAASFRSLDILVNNNNNSSSESEVEGGGSLLSTLNECKTALGSRMLRRRLQAPMTQISAINTALDGVQFFVDADESLVERVRHCLDSVSDVERILQRLLLFRPQGVSRDLRSLSRSLLAGREALQLVNDGTVIDNELLGHLQRVLQFICEDKLPLRDSEGGLIVSGVDAELDDLRRLRDDSESVFSELEASYRQLSTVPNLRIVPFKGDQHVIEVPKSCLDLMAREPSNLPF